MNKVLVLPDVHGRRFWKKPCENIEPYDKVIFLGDYLDPYDFEYISVPHAIVNFEEIIDFKKKNNDKVILLIGNHDCPYAFKDYFKLSSYHCRHSSMFHKTISGLFEDNKDLFQLAYAYKDILFTHAGVESGWLDNVVKCDKTDINDIADTLNSLINDSNGLKKLFCITDQRGGRDKWGSCIWCDVNDIRWDVDSLHYPETTPRPIHKVKQVFGHTLQAFYDVNRNIAYGEAIEFGNCKMVDTTSAYILNTDTFEIQVFN